MPKQITTIRLDETDRQAIHRLRGRYGYPSDADVIRAAIRYLDASPGLKEPAKKIQEKILEGA